MNDLKSTVKNLKKDKGRKKGSRGSDGEPLNKENSMALIPVSNASDVNDEEDNRSVNSEGSLDGHKKENWVFAKFSC
jgi:hypothetical protein